MRKQLGWILVGALASCLAVGLLYGWRRAAWAKETAALVARSVADSTRHVADSAALEASRHVVDSLRTAAAADTARAAVATTRGDQAARTAEDLTAALDEAETLRDSVETLVARDEARVEEIGELRVAVAEWRAAFATQGRAVARLEADLAIARADADRLAATNDDLRRQLERVPAGGVRLRLPLGKVVKVVAVAGAACLAVC